jgi:hypothetical protein
MINDIDLSKGSIWEFFYFTQAVNNIDPQLEQRMLDDQTREITSNMFNPPPGLTPDDYSQLFMNHFLESRNKSREIINKSNLHTVRNRVLLQVGNEECMRDIDNIEKLESFIKWENESLIAFFKQISQSYEK